MLHKPTLIASLAILALVVSLSSCTDGTEDAECRGVPDSCYTYFSHDSCVYQLGCTWDETCQGVAPSCYAQLDEWACGRVDGCSWYSNSCNGVATSCYSLQWYECTYQDGCYTTGDCNGTPLSCDLFPMADCEDQDGCEWK